MADPAGIPLFTSGNAYAATATGAAHPLGSLIDEGPSVPFLTAGNVFRPLVPAATSPTQR